MALGKTKASDLEKLIISFTLKESRRERERERESIALYHILLPVFIIMTTSDEGVMLFHYVNCQGFFALKLLSTELTYVESILWR